MREVIVPGNPLGAARAVAVPLDMAPQFVALRARLWRAFAPDIATQRRGSSTFNWLGADLGDSVIQII